MTQEEKQEDKKIKLSKCPNCGQAFYIKTSKKGEIKITCPFCEQNVSVTINGEEEIKNDDRNI